MSGKGSRSRPHAPDACPNRTYVDAGPSGESRAPLAASAPLEHTGALGRAVAEALAPLAHRELGFDLEAAIRARRARLVAVHTTDGRPLPTHWAIPVQATEVVLVCARLPAPWSGVAALIVQQADLPKPKLDGVARERIARALLDALLATPPLPHEPMNNEPRKSSR